MTNPMLAFALMLLSIPSFGSRVVQGNVVDAETGRAVPDAILTSGERTTSSGNSGYFSFNAEGNRVAVRAPGYLAATYTDAEIAATLGILRLTPFTPKALYLSVYGIGSEPLRNGAMALIRHGIANALVIDIKGDRGIVPTPHRCRSHSPTMHDKSPRSRASRPW